MVRSVSIIVPAYNEGPALGAVLARLCAETEPLRARRPLEIVVVDDGSTDETAAVIRAAAATLPIRSVAHERNAGLVAAMRTGSLAAAHETLVFLDADLSYAPAVAAELVDALERSGAAVAIASPYMRGGRVANVPFDRLLASRTANLLLSACVLGGLKTFTGMVRAYPADVARRLLAREPAGEFNSWAVAELVRERAPIVEIPAALIWPRERYEAASRLTLRSLRSRTAGVLRTLVLLGQGTLSGYRML